MEITIIGWYGTETVGDRAILAGILRVLSLTYDNFHIRLGSLYPFFSERTVYEDIEFYKIAAQNDKLTLSIFDSLDSAQLRQNIKSSDLLLVGGGPLEDLAELNMLFYAFRFAKKHRVKSILLGCGWGPLKNYENIALCKGLVDMSALTIFRDETSLKEYEKISPNKKNAVYSLLDPAFIACKIFLDNYQENPTNDYIAINFRDVSLEGSKYMNTYPTQKILCDYVRNVVKLSDLPIKLVPMHNFYIGGDDRVILHEIASDINNPHVQVIHSPLSLYETMSCFYNAALCVGMRFHSIVLQTVLNGKNFILDYTDPCIGKTIGMMKSINMLDFYKDRYHSFHSALPIQFTGCNDLQKFKVKDGLIKDILNQYVRYMKSVRL